MHTVHIYNIDDVMAVFIALVVCKVMHGWMVIMSDEGGSDFFAFFVHVHLHYYCSATMMVHFSFIFILNELCFELGFTYLFF